MLKNSTHFRIFNASGVEYQNSFIFKILSKYGKIQEFFNIISILNNANINKFSFKRFLKYLCKFVYTNRDFLKKKQCLIFFFQFYIKHILYKVLKEKNTYLVFLNN